MKSELFYLAMLITAAGLLTSCQQDDDQNPTEEPGTQNAIALIEGSILYLDTPPVSLELDVLVDDDHIFMFAEKVDYELSTDIIIDLSLPGDYFPDSLDNEEQTWENLNPGLITAGTRINSYYMHYNNATYKESFNLFNYLNCIGQYRVEAEITFNTPVIGLIMRADLNENDHLGNSNAELGVPSVDYCEHNLQHFPGINVADGCRSDRFILSLDRKKLTIRNNTDIHHDNYRILVEGM